MRLGLQGRRGAANIDFLDHAAVRTGRSRRLVPNSWFLFQPDVADVIGKRLALGCNYILIYTSPKGHTILCLLGAAHNERVIPIQTFFWASENDDRVDEALRFRQPPIYPDPSVG